MTETIRRCGDYLTAEMDDSLVILDEKNGKYINFGTPGSDIWKLTEEPVEFCVLIDRLCGMYDVERTVCEADVREFIDGLVSRGLVEIVETE